MEQNERSQVQQTIVHLPYLNDEVPALITQDQKQYVPVIAVCKALGIRADIHIRKWSRMLIWHTACKLLYQSEHGYRRVVWCFPLGLIPSLYGQFNWDLLHSEERRALVEKATHEFVKLSGQLYLKQIELYHAQRRSLFSFLATFEGFEERMRQRAQRLTQVLDPAIACRFELLVEEGNALVAQAATLARSILQKQAELPIADTFAIAPDGTAVEATPIPILPILYLEEAAQFFQCTEQLQPWYEKFDAFLCEQGW